MEQEVTVLVVANGNYTNEISWNIDGGAKFPSPLYKDNTSNTQTFTLPNGNHMMNYFDQFSDGWEESYWQVNTKAPDGTATVRAGGPIDGKVTAAGGSTAFCVGPCAGTTATTPTASVNVVVLINTTEWADEVTWSLDDGSVFGKYPKYQDRTSNMTNISLGSGTHTIKYFDEFSDGELP